MKISVAGEDKTDELAGNLRNVIEMRSNKACEEAGREDEVLGLASAGNENEFAGRHMDLLRQHCSVDPGMIRITPGSAAGMVRKVLWLLIRPLFDWISQRQNLINTQLVQAVDMERRIRERELLHLKKEIESLKKRVQQDCKR